MFHKQWLAHFLSTLERIFSPFYPYSLKSPIAQRRATITTTVLLVLLLVIPAGIIIRWTMKGEFFILDFVILVATFLAYLSARTRFYTIGTIFLIFVMCFIAYFDASRYIHSGTQDVTSWLVWLVLPLLTTSLLLSWRAMIGVAPIPAIFLLIFIVRERPENWGALMAVLSTGAFISVAIAYTYDTDLRLIHNQNILFQKQNKQLLLAYDETLLGWAKILEMRDKETQGHSERVTEMTIKIAKEIGINDETELRHIRYGSLLHDIGKIAISDSILHKPGALTQDEKKIMQRHTEYAYEWLKDIEFLHPILDIPRYHHEKWDGSGYNELKGEQTPLYARIFAVADCWDALISDRDYRQAWTKEKAIAYITEKAGFEFDPQIAQAFLKIIQKSNSLLPASVPSSPVSA
jgi:HD-GYP domain-containing protein (c-di-GMP phosphodiesterase class II)